jgi:5-methylcytosine-specific restriction endonuclease McrA
MGRQVLVLNQDFRALTTTSAYKAFVLLFLEKADMISPADNFVFRTVSTSYPVPSIIRLKDYVHIPYKGIVLTRLNIFKRDNFQCQYCGSTQDLTLDHVMPRSRGGATSWENLSTACKKCNSKKGSLTPEEARMPLAHKPYKPSFIMFLREHNGSVDQQWLTYLGTKKEARFRFD